MHRHDPTALTDEASLRDRYRDPHELVLRKQQPNIDAGARAFVESSPFVVLATAAASGADASPRGGPPGFVAVLDEQHLAFGDLSGNNRLDSFANITRHPDVGMLFFVPGSDETLRVNGRARLTTDASVLDRTTVAGVRPKIAVVVAVTECFVHCGKAVRRAGLWDTSRWASPDERPSAAAILTTHLSLDVDPSVVEADLEAGYRETMWLAGGDGDT